MSFLMSCDNKGCHKENEPLLDVDTNEVMCSECGKAIKGVTSFAKASLKTMGQIKRATKAQEAFSVTCEGCKVVAQPKLVEGKLACPKCKQLHLHISPPFASTVKQYLIANSKKV